MPLLQDMQALLLQLACRYLIPNSHTCLQLVSILTPCTLQLKLASGLYTSLVPTPLTCPMPTAESNTASATDPQPPRQPTAPQPMALSAGATATTARKRKRITLIAEPAAQTAIEGQNGCPAQSGRQSRTRTSSVPVQQGRPATDSGRDAAAEALPVTWQLLAEAALPAAPDAQSPADKHRQAVQLLRTALLVPVESDRFTGMTVVILHNLEQVHDADSEREVLELCKLAQVRPEHHTVFAHWPAKWQHNG